jgi:hypothetical protein
MSNITFNGIPILTYGLIGVTTVLLTYSVFSDDSKPQESLSKESGIAGLLTFPTQSGEETPKKEEETPKKEEETPTKEETPIKPEETPINTPDKEGASVGMIGGKRKRTKRHRNKNKKTKHSRK